MSKKDVIAVVSKKAEVSKKDTEQVINAFLDTITETLAGGETVQLIGFGTFKVSSRAMREGRNPQTGEAMKISASKTATFKPGKRLKDKVNR